MQKREKSLVFYAFEDVLFLELLDDYACFVEKLHGKLVGVGVFVHNSLYAAVDDDTGADGAGLMRAI